jgi:hypothetical protein
MVPGADVFCPVRNALSSERWHVAGLDHSDRVSRQHAGAPTFQV